MYWMPSTAKETGGASTPGVGLEVPELLAGLGVERPEHAVVGAAVEHEAATGGQDRAPVHGVIEQMGPGPLAGADVPRLDLAIGARVLVDREADVGDRHAGPPLAGHVFFLLAFQMAAVVVVGRDVDHAGLRVVGLVRPVLAAPQRRAEVGVLAGAGLVVLIVGRPAGLGIDALEDGLLDVWLGVDEADLAVVAALEPVQIAVARRMDQFLERPCRPSGSRRASALSSRPSPRSRSNGTGSDP